MNRLAFLLFFSLSCNAYEYNVAICSVFQNEAPYMKEWIEFHRIIGVEHFYLYNHCSTDDYLAVLAPYIEEGIVELVEWNIVAKSRDHWHKIQSSARNDGVKRALGRAKWFGFIDLDEFIFPSRDYFLNDLLKNYEDYGGVVLHWQVFGTSNIELLNPNLLMIEQLVYRNFRKAFWNRVYKSIALTDRIDVNTLERIDTHRFSYKKPFFAVNTNYTKVENVGYHPEKPTEVAVINHYMFRDEYFFRTTKLERPNMTPKRKQETIERAKTCNQEKDEGILIYADQLRAAVFEEK